MAKQDEIRHIYHELQGYVSQAPSHNDSGPYIQHDAVWKQANQTIEELNGISGKDYSRFKMIPRRIGSSQRDVLDKDTYRTNLAGLVARLHGEYFASEPAPFGGMPSTVISQTQVQSQTQTQMVLDLQTKIDDQLRKLEPGDKRHTFLEKVKSALASVKDYAGLHALYITTAQQCGLTLKELLDLIK